MSSVTRHPSSPRKSAVTPREALPVAFCVKCYFLGPALPKDGPGGRYYECPHCGGLELIPPDTQRARDHFGARYESALMQAQEAARQFAVEREKALRIHEAQIAAMRRAQHRIVIPVAIGFGVLLLIGVAWLWRYAQHPVPIESTQTQAIAAREVAATAAEEAQRQLDAARFADVEKLLGAAPQPTARLTIFTSGTALSRPVSGDPVMRVTAGETYTRGEERDGWVRLGDAPVEAWVSAEAVR